MSVFHPRDRNRRGQLIEGAAEVPCRRGHTWDSIKPTVDPNIHEPQNSHLLSLPCDCGKFSYSEAASCSCSGSRWEVTLVPVN